MICILKPHRPHVSLPLVSIAHKTITRDQLFCTFRRNLVENHHRRSPITDLHPSTPGKSRKPPSIPSSSHSKNSNRNRKGPPTSSILFVPRNTIADVQYLPRNLFSSGDSVEIVVHLVVFFSSPLVVMVMASKAT
jgi:hypothetical protein